MGSVVLQPSTSSAPWRSARLRVVAWQAALLVALGFAAYAFYETTRDNLARRGITSGFGFLASEAGFGISETPPIPLPGSGLLVALGGLTLGALILWRMVRIGVAGGFAAPTILLLIGLPAALVAATGLPVASRTYSAESAYALALATGFANTVKIALIGCLLTTVLGLAIGIASQSTNLLLRGLSRVYVEVFRNVPLLIQVVFWYFGVLRTLPGVRDSVVIFDLFVLNNRGVLLPAPEAADGFWPVVVALAAGLALAWTLARWADRYQASTGWRPPAGLLSLVGGFGLLFVAWMCAGVPLAFEYPRLAGFNYVGGLHLTPEYTALLLGLVTYTAAFVAEIVRAGLEAVPRGQMDAALSLGLPHHRALRLVVLPQALRVAVPPLIAQYLSLTKDSSLGLVIAYPELVSVGNTMINHTGQAIEVLVLLMAAYMALNLSSSAVLNRYNAAVQWRER